jgi:hypothetical protein
MEAYEREMQERNNDFLLNNNNNVNDLSSSPPLTPSNLIDQLNIDKIKDEINSDDESPFSKTRGSKSQRTDVLSSPSPK